ncbi:hypothetical protein EON81_13375 [bacterium]|nr:MAG: hypothetical protein EON81_13375 [bacterium]
MAGSVAGVLTVFLHWARLEWSDGYVYAGDLTYLLLIYPMVGGALSALFMGMKRQPSLSEATLAMLVAATLFFLGAFLLPMIVRLIFLRPFAMIEAESLGKEQLRYGGFLLIPFAMAALIPAWFGMAMTHAITKKAHQLLTIHRVQESRAANLGLPASAARTKARSQSADPGRGIVLQSVGKPTRQRPAQTAPAQAGTRKAGRLQRLFIHSARSQKLANQANSGTSMKYPRGP